MSILDKLAAKLGFARVPETLANKLQNGSVEKSSWDSLWLKSLETQLQGNSVTEPYNQHQTVFMAIDAIADTAPQVNFKLYKGENGPEATGHPMLKLLDRPNPLMCRFQLWEATLVYLKMRGGCFWVFGESVGQQAGTSKVPSEIWVFSPDKWKKHIDKDTGHLIGWTYANNVYFKADEVVYFHKFNPFDRIDPNNPVAKVMKTIDLDYKSLLYNSAFFNNSAVPDGFLSTEKGLTETQYKRLITQFESRHGGINKARRVALLEGGLKYQAGAESHRDMEFMEQRRYNREEILGIWRVPKTIFSITEDLNYATAREQKKLFWENCIIPALTYIQEQVNAFFLPKFAPELYGAFDYTNVTALMADFKEKAEIATQLYALGFTANEINRRLDLGFDDKPWRDKWWITYGQVPADMVLDDPFGGLGGPGDPAADPEDDPATEDPEAVFNDPAKMGKLFKAVHAKDASALWDRFTRQVTPIETAMAQKIKRYFFEARKTALAAVEKDFAGWSKKGLNDLQGLPWDELEALLLKSSRPFMIQAAQRGAENAAKDLERNINFEIFNPKILSFIQTRQSKIRRVNETVKKQVSEIVQRGITEGASVQQVSKELRNMFNFAAKRSLMIARTEVVGGTNGGQLLYYREAGVTRKKWITAKDERVRPSHQKLEGQVVEIGKNFTNGLDHPGGNGPAAEVINCRCTVTPVI